MSEIEEELILSGTWLYDGSKENEVHVIKTNFKPGTGDDEDEPEVKEDQYGIFYGIHIGTLSGKQPFMGGAYSSVKEAKEYASTVCPSLNWNNSEENA